jgi:hypothetical protein
MSMRLANASDTHAQGYGPTIRSGRTHSGLSARRAPAPTRLISLGHNSVIPKPRSEACPCSQAGLPSPPIPAFGGWIS